MRRANDTLKYGIHILYKKPKLFTKIHNIFNKAVHSYYMYGNNFQETFGVHILNIFLH